MDDIHYDTNELYISFNSRFSFIFWLIDYYNYLLVKIYNYIIIYIHNYSLSVKNNISRSNY